MDNIKTKKSIFRRRGVWVPILFSVLIWMVVLSGDWGNNVDSQNAASEERAYTIAKNYVEVVLKAPSTANFPLYEFSSQDLGDGKYKVSSYVNAENSFGAMIRTDWSAVLQYKSGNWADPSNWELEELTVDGEAINL